MGKVVGAVALSLAVASASQGWSQEIGIVSAKPNAVTNELIADIPARPDGDKVYIVRDGVLVTEATVKTSGGQGGAVISLPDGKATVVQVGDRISVSPTLSKQLPKSAYEVKIKGDTILPHPGQQQLAAANGGERTFSAAEVGAPEPVAIGAPVGGAVTEVSAASTSVQLEKGVEITQTREVEAITAEPTPRGTGVPLFPAPAVTAEMGITAPYGQGLAAAAPVGTPYLRSPAFAGPPIIYMPQTVTRVLLPGATPYPSNIMSPPSQYVYASAPFIRTDIYTSLPYGTFYWPQGYAGTTPVEPQVPAYVTAPASAIMSTEADYTAGRYEPGLAAAETINPITAGINANLVASTGLTGQENGMAATVSATGQQGAAGLTVAPETAVYTESLGPEAGVSVETQLPAAAVPAEVAPFPVLSDTTSEATISATTTSAVADGVPVLPTLPPATTVTPALPTIPTADPAPALPTLPAVEATPVSGLPELPATPAAPDAAALPTLPPASTEVAAALPNLPAAGAAPTPASMAPSLPTPAVPPAPASVIIIDDKTPGGLTLEPATAWTPLTAATADSHEGGSLIAKVAPGQAAKATFNATIPADGQYEVALWWVMAPGQFRPSSVPVTVNTATGPQQVTIDQTQSGQWHVLGTYQLKAGDNAPVVTISTDGIVSQGDTVSVSVDALRLTPQ